MNATLLASALFFSVLMSTGRLDSKRYLSHPQPGLFTHITVPQNRNSITGHVFNSSRTPLGQVYVELQDDFNSTIQRVRTENSGRYAFNGLVTGVYQVVVQPYGTDYESQTQRVQIDSLSPTGRGSQSLQVDFTLRLKHDSKSLNSSKGRVVFAQEVPPAAKKAYQAGVALLESGKDNEGGIKQIIKATEIFPQYYDALERLGSEYLKLQNYRDALPVLSKAVQVYPQADESFYFLGIAQYQSKDISAAIESLSRATFLSPSSINYQMWLGKAFWKDGRTAEAETHFKEAYKLGGKRIAIVHLYLAQLYDKQKRYSDEIKELELYLQEEAEPSNVESIRTAIVGLRKKLK